MRNIFVAAVATSFVLTACGTGSADTAADPGSNTSPSATPTSSPTVGSYPSYEPKDYTYTLRISCFCAGAGAPVHVTVVDGKITEAVYAESGRGVDKGDEVGEYQQVTINDVIDAANDTEAASVKVRWPEGQAYPNSVSVDKDKLTMDEEVGYFVSDVAVG